MKLLVVDPGASVSTHDVSVGLIEALKLREHDVFEYALDARIERSGAWLTYCWKRGGKTVAKPMPADILYHAGEELVARALRVQPDWVLVVSAMYLHPDVFVLMRRAGLRVAVLFTESPYDDEKQARLLPWVDVAWTHERSSARKLGIGYVPHAFRPDLHRPDLSIVPGTPAHDVVFVGTGFPERVELLSAVDWTGIDLGLYGTWELVGSRSRLRDYIRGGYRDNRDTTQLYRRAKVGLNLYRETKGFGRAAPRTLEGESLNLRAYELAATGCFTVSQYRAEVAELFGAAVPTFRTAEELQQVLHSWLHNDKGRAEVAAALPALVRTQTWAARAAQIEADLHSVGTVAGYALHRRAEARTAGG